LLLRIADLLQPHYAYFGEPVYLYSLKEGINDGFLTPFKVKRIQTTLDDYIYTPDDHIIEGEVAPHELEWHRK
jgi:type I restriction enzyme R subunit